MTETFKKRTPVSLWFFSQLLNMCIIQTVAEDFEKRRRRKKRFPAKIYGVDARTVERIPVGVLKKTNLSRCG